MSSRRLKRIIKEIKELEDSVKIFDESGIYYHYNDEDVGTLYAMIIGPEKTPYEKGFYFFKFTYPENYPMEPIKAKYMTQGTILNVNSISGMVRFNPNLYVDGKVCLSMLNTWSGPGWVPTNTICNVLVAIQALVLNEEPIKNEPGYELCEYNILKKYNDIIEYANIKVAVLDMIQKQPEGFEVFKDKMIELYLKNIEFYRKVALDNIHIRQIISPIYGMSASVDYQSILYDVEKEYENYNTK